MPGRVDEVLQHPRYHLHVIAARGRHVLGREHLVATPLGYLGRIFSNTVHRKALGAWLERVVFSSPWGMGLRAHRCPHRFHSARTTFAPGRCASRLPISWTPCRRAAPFRSCCRRCTH